MKNTKYRGLTLFPEVTGINWDHELLEPPGNDDIPKIRSSDGGPHIFRSWIQVMEIRGPTRSGVDNRGVDRIRFGFVQASRYLIKRSYYDGFLRKSELEEKPVSLDRFLTLEEGLWIEKEEYNHPTSSLVNRYSFHHPDENEEIGLGDNHLVFHYEYRRGSAISGGDRPGISISDKYEFTGKKPHDFNIDVRNYLYLCVNTVSGDEDADGYYYILADTGSWWRYTAYGQIENNEVLPPNEAHDDYTDIGDMWGAYEASSFIVRNNGFAELKNVHELHENLDETHLVVQEYPILGGGVGNSENWENE